MKGHANGDHKDHLTAKATILWNFFLDHLTQARPHETLRAGTTATVVLGAGAIVTAEIGSDATAASSPTSLEGLVAGLAVTALGVLGYLSATKHFQLHSRQLEIAYSYRDAISALYSKGSIIDGYYQEFRPDLEIDGTSQTLSDPSRCQSVELPLFQLRERGGNTHLLKWGSRSPGSFADWWDGKIVNTRLSVLTNLIQLVTCLMGLILIIKWFWNLLWQGFH